MPKTTTLFALAFSAAFAFGTALPHFALADATSSPLSLSTPVMGYGSTGVSVQALQAFLNSHGYAVAATGPGSRGQETSYFGPLTRAALAKYQAANGISPAAGYFGTLTRAQVAQQAGSSTTTSAFDPSNGTYSFMGDTFALADGSATIQGHAGLSGADASALVPVGYTLAATTTGDVNGDGAPDTVVALYRGFGANLEWVSLFAFAPDGTQLASSTAYTYDSRVQSVSVKDGVVSLDLLVVSAADQQNLPHYQQVPNQPMTLRFTVADGAFAPAS